NNSVVHSSAKRFYAVPVTRGACSRATFQAELPCMERAHDVAARDNPVSQRPSAMRTAVVHSQKAAAEIEDRDLSVSNADGPSFAHWNIVTMSNAKPHGFAGHTSTSSNGVICTN